MTTPRRVALLVVDVQNDFFTGGALPVPNVERIVSNLNRYLRDALQSGVEVYASRDWHPPKSSHFTASGGRWPTHCVKDTDGARFHSSIELPETAIVITKGEDPASDGYSAFDGRTPKGASLLADLQAKGIEELFVCGVATEHCVKASVLDALSAGFRVGVLEDAIAGIEFRTSQDAMTEMRGKGAQLIARPHL